MTTKTSKGAAKITKANADVKYELAQCGKQSIKSATSIQKLER